MKSSFITFISLFFFLIGAVVAAPTTLDSTEIVQKRDTENLETILHQTHDSIIEKNAAYNATATATNSDVTAYCNDIIVIIKIAIGKCKLIPPEQTFLDINLIATLLFNILCEINFTLQLLLWKCGLLGGLILLITLLVGGLIGVLNQLLVVVAGRCAIGLLQLLLSLILTSCGSNFLLLLLGLIII